MKKSQLLKIIRESVKETLNEQTTPHNFVGVCNCEDYDIATGMCLIGLNGPFGTWKMNVALVPIGSTLSGAVGANVGDIMCNMDNVINGGASNSGNISDCTTINNQGQTVTTQRRIVLGIPSGTNVSGFAENCLLPPNTACGIGCTDPNYQNYNPNASHSCNNCCGPAHIPGCTDGDPNTNGGIANNYTPFATIDDGSCIYIGCADPTAVNYDPNDDGCGIPPTSSNTSCCDYEGCADSAAVNYDPIATIDNGTCYGCVDPMAFPSSQCSLCIADCNQDPIGTNNPGWNSCCSFPTIGCTDPLACNYNSAATQDDGSCFYPDGCTDPNACNYDPTAQCDDGSCSGYYGCTDPTATNYDPNAGCDDGSCIYPAPIEGCNDPSAVHCSQQPGILQNLSNCYDPNHEGCNGNPNDTSCCLYEARDREDTSPPLLPCNKFWNLPIQQQEGCCLKCNDPGIYPSHYCYPYCHCCDNKSSIKERFQKLANIKK